jgi:hypothetical protein
MDWHHRNVVVGSKRRELNGHAAKHNAQRRRKNATSGKVAVDIEVAN